MSVLAETRDPNPRSVDRVGLAALAAGLFCVVFGLVRAESWGWGDPRIGAVLSLGLVLLVLLGWIERKVAAPLLPPRLWANRGLTLGVIEVTFAFFAMFGVLFFMTLYLENVGGYDPVGAGVRILPLTATFGV